MKFTLEINMDNAAFEDPNELTECLQQATLSVMGFDLALLGAGKPFFPTKGVILDTNGNKVGTWEVTE